MPGSPTSSSTPAVLMLTFSPGAAACEVAPLAVAGTRARPRAGRPRWPQPRPGAPFASIGVAPGRPSRGTPESGPRSPPATRPQCAFHPGQDDPDDPASPDSGADFRGARGPPLVY